MTAPSMKPFVETEISEGSVLSDDISLRLWAATMTLTAVFDSVMKEPSLSESDASRIQSMLRPWVTFLETFQAIYPSPTSLRTFANNGSAPSPTSSRSPSRTAPRKRRNSSVRTKKRAKIPRLMTVGPEITKS